MSPVYISGMGAVSCAGYGADRLWRSARDGVSHIAGGLGRVSEDVPKPAGLGSRAARLAHAAYTEAMKQALWANLGPDDGIILATTTGQIDVWEPQLKAFYRKELSSMELAASLRHQPLGSLTETIRLSTGATGPATVLTSACSASTQALAMGALWIQSKVVKRCLVGGVEVLSGLTIDGFKSLQLLSEATCTPFDSSRAGINLSEGAAFLCLEGKTAREPLAELSGWGFSSDAFHVTSPHPEGRGCYNAMKSALETARLTAEEITWVHCHGTGSAANDLSEGIAIHQLLGKTPASSTKAIHGHALAASGALEAVICVGSLREGVIPASHNLSVLDPKIPATILREPKMQRIDHIIKNTLGFGGNNAALVISRPGVRA